MAELLPQSQLPMIRLGLIKPFLSTLDFPAGRVERVLGELDITRKMLDRDDMFVAAQTMYELVERLSEASEDTYAGVHVGEALNVLEWAPVAEAMAQANSFGDFLLRFAIAANRDATSVVYSLETRRERATFSERRASNFGIRPAHNDGFGVGYIGKIMLMAQGRTNFGDAVIAHVCDPSVIPPSYLGLRVASTNNLGFSLSFPASWLVSPLQPVMQETSDASLSRPGVPTSAIEAMARLLEPHLADPSLSTARVAELMGTSERTLARHLAVSGTTILRELTRLRMEAATRLLADTDATVQEIASQVGYVDPGTFSRAFRRWCDASPTSYRLREGRISPRA